jgi:tRNA1Val (adenine37-N6)-methyltransferase
MANQYFSFKQFTVHQNLCAMKVGIDGVLLGAWASIENSSAILDIGTGSGLIALMLAQRSKAQENNTQIFAIDVDMDAIAQATENIRISPWSNCIECENVALQKFALSTHKKFDLIVSNPPFFVNSTKTPTEKRTIARHTDSLTHEELIDNAIVLLNTTGRICLILPVNEGLKCIEYAVSKGLFCNKKTVVYPKNGAIAKRLLIELSFQADNCVESELVIESNERHQYSPQFTDLAKDFYLKL